MHIFSKKSPPPAAEPTPPKEAGDWPSSALKTLIAVEEIHAGGGHIHGVAVGPHHRELARVLKLLHPDAKFAQTLDSVDVWVKYRDMARPGDGELLPPYRESDPIKAYEIKETYYRTLKVFLEGKITDHLRIVEEDLVSCKEMMLLVKNARERMLGEQVAKKGAWFRNKKE